MNPRIDEMVQELRGTCDDSLDDEIDALPAEEQALLNEQIFRCEGCGWWCATDELNNDGPMQRELCDDCSDEETE